MDSYGKYYLYNTEWQEVCIGCDDKEFILQHMKDFNLDPNIYIVMTAEYYWAEYGQPMIGIRLA